jgi:hypothetical protein
MDLKNFASGLTAANRFVKASFGGFAGSGKTRTSTEFIIGVYKEFEIPQDKPLLIIDNEKGARFLIPLFQKELPELKVIVKETEQLADVLQAIEFLNEGQIGFLFIDSLSKVWYKYVRQYMEGFGTYDSGKRVGKFKKQFMTLQDWGNVIPAWQKEFADVFVKAEGNIVFTGRGGNTYEMEEVEEHGRTKKQFVKSGVKMKMAGETPFEPDLNVWLEIRQEVDENKNFSKLDRVAYVMKDRSDTIDGKTFINPKFKDFKPAVDFLKGLPTGTVKRETKTESLAPGESTGHYKDKRNAEIEYEKVRNILLKLNVGSSADHKRYVVQLFEYVFGTGSATEVQNLRGETLREGRIEMERLLNGAKSPEDIPAYIQIDQDEKKQAGELPFEKKEEKPKDSE